MSKRFLWRHLDLFTPREIAAGSAHVQGRKFERSMASFSKRRIATSTVPFCSSTLKPHPPPPKLILQPRRNILQVEALQRRVRMRPMDHNPPWPLSMNTNAEPRFVSIAYPSSAIMFRKLCHATVPPTASEDVGKGWRKITRRCFGRM
jgi:hypothetical protein